MFISLLRRIFFSKIMQSSSVNLSMNSRLVWIDCEMTGLDLEKNRLVEVACIITDSQLEIIDKYGPIIIHQPTKVLENMDEWCKTTFSKNGLLEKIHSSKINENEAEQKILKFLIQHTNPKMCPLAGNSVHADKRFLAKYMPKIVEHLHYRIVDVSTIKELIYRWYPKTKLDQIPIKENHHLALYDIQESIAELKYYRKHFFV